MNLSEEETQQTAVDEEPSGENHISCNTNFDVKAYQRYFDYFEENGVKKARCRKCKEPTTRPNSATNAMDNHLKNCNKLAWEVLKSLRSSKKQKSSSNALASTKWTDNDLRSIDMDKNWLKVICLNLHPLSFTEQNGFELICDSR